MSINFFYIHLFYLIILIWNHVIDGLTLQYKFIYRLIAGESILGLDKHDWVIIYFLNVRKI